MGGLVESLYYNLAGLARRYGAERLTLFGSRARGDNKPRSDVDIAVYGMPEQNRAPFALEADELPTLLKLDIVHIRPDIDKALLANIEKDGKVIYEKA